MEKRELVSLIKAQLDREITADKLLSVAKGLHIVDEDCKLRKPTRTNPQSVRIKNIHTSEVLEFHSKYSAAKHLNVKSNSLMAANGRKKPYKKTWEVSIL